MDMAVIKRTLLASGLAGYLFFSPCKTVAQAASASPSGPWTVFLSGNISLDSITHYLNLHSRYRISFDSRDVQSNKPIYFQPRAYPIEAILRRIQSAEHLKFYFYGDHIIFRHPPPKPPGKMPASGIAAPRQPLDAVGSRHTARAATPVHLSPITLARIVADSQTPPMIEARPLRSTRSRSNVIAATATHHQAFDPHWQLGCSANEVLYGNLMAEGGFRFLHLVFAGSLSPHEVTWGAGLGSVIAGNEDQQLQVRLLYSPLHFTYNNQIDTLHKIDITAKGQLYRLELLWCKQLAGHWSLKVGPAFSLLKTSYYSQGVQTAPENSFPANENADRLLYLLKPPFLIHNTFSNTTARNNKLWPGLSLSIDYTF